MQEEDNIQPIDMTDRKNRHITHTILLIMGLALCTGARGQVAASLDDDTIALGDQTVLRYGPAPSYPSSEQLSEGDILALDQQFDTTTGVLSTVITSFEPGEHWIHLGTDDSIPLVVTDVEVDTASTEIRDIAPLIAVPYTFWEIFRWVLLALAIAAIAFAAWWFVSHRQKVQQVLGLVEKPDTRTPYERATDELHSLRDRKLWQAGQVKQFYTELTDIVRRFIEESTGIRATDMTSDQTADAVQPMCDTAPLKRLFALADLVKFARREPLPHEHEDALAQAGVFVDTLWQTVKPATEEAPHE